MHYSWGDDRIDWNELNSAGSYIDKMYCRLSSTKWFSWKEKYGTMRYEFLTISIANKDDVKLLLKIVKKATKKYPKVDALIVQDLMWCLDPKDDPIINYHMGYFEAIMCKWNIPEEIC